jgi:hypothetical protein
MLADAAIREANPEMLVIVSGLCRSYDLRAMQDLENYRSKYVFTTHSYTWSWWFTRVDWVLVMWLSLLFSAGNLGVAVWLRRKHVLRTYIAARKDAHSWAYVLAAGGLAPLYVLVVSVLWVYTANQNGCSSIAEDATGTLVLGVLGVTAWVLACCVLATHENELRWSRLATNACLCNAWLGLLQAGFSVFYQTYWAVLWELRRWDSRKIPVWVGEFGTVVGDTSEAWGWMMTYVRHMHYAYWPLNGCKERVGTISNDSYGILDCDWKTVRDWNWTRSIFQDE